MPPDALLHRLSSEVDDDGLLTVRRLLGARVMFFCRFGFGAVQILNVVGGCGRRRATARCDCSLFTDCLLFSPQFYRIFVTREETTKRSDLPSFIQSLESAQTAAAANTAAVVQEAEAEVKAQQRQQHQSHAHAHAHSHEPEKKLGRKRKDPEPVLSNQDLRKLDMGRITRALSQRRCCGKFPDAWCTQALAQNPLAVLKLRNDYVGHARERERARFIVDILSASASPECSLSKSKHKHKHCISLLGHRLCMDGVRRVLGCSKDKFWRAVKEWHRSSGLPPPQASTGTAKPALQSDWVFGWLTNRFELVCDDVPTCKGTMRVLPFFQKWRELYTDMLKDFDDQHAQSPIDARRPSFFTFQSVRHAHFSNVVRPRKATQRLPVCTVCVGIANARERSDAASRKKLNEQMAKHAAAHVTERRALQAEIQRRITAGDTLIIRIDYTTSAFLPHFVRPPKVRASHHSSLSSCLHLLLCRRSRTNRRSRSNYAAPSSMALAHTTG